MNTSGIILAGGVLVLLNQHKSWDELSYELGLVEPAAILTDGDDYGTKEQLQAAYGSILRPMDGFRAYEPVAEMPRCIGHDDLMILMFTSGTTGRSKGVMLSERNFFSVMRAHVQIGERMMEISTTRLWSASTRRCPCSTSAFICLFSGRRGWALTSARYPQFIRRSGGCPVRSRRWCR
ncbi:MAG: AMP-binding protein [Faecalibacterium prausnitzii]